MKKSIFLLLLAIGAILLDGCQKATEVPALNTPETGDEVVTSRTDGEGYTWEIASPNLISQDCAEEYAVSRGQSPCCCFEFAGYQPLPFPPYIPVVTFVGKQYTVFEATHYRYYVKVTWQGLVEYEGYTGDYFHDHPCDYGVGLGIPVYMECKGTRQVYARREYRINYGPTWYTCSTATGSFYYPGTPGVFCE